MLRNVFLKTLRDYRRSLIGWSVGLAAFAAYVVALYPSIREGAAQLEQYLEQVPEGLKAFIGGDLSDFATPQGYLNTEFFPLLLPLLFLIFAIGFGSRAIAGEERAGTLELLLATPITRRRVLLEKLTALAVGVALLALVFWAALAVGTSLAGMDVSSSRIAEATISAGLLAMAFGTLALAVGSWTGSRAVANSVASTVALTTYMVNALAPLADWLEPLRIGSPFYYYISADPLRNGIDPAHAAVLAVGTAVLATVALVVLDRRDLAV